MNQFVLDKFVSHLVVEIMAAGVLIGKAVVGEIDASSLNFWALVTVLGSCFIVTVHLIAYTRRKIKSLTDQS